MNRISSDHFQVIRKISALLFSDINLLYDTSYYLYCSLHTALKVLTHLSEFHWCCSPNVRVNIINPAIAEGARLDFPRGFEKQVHKSMKKIRHSTADENFKGFLKTLMVQNL